jgi:hypothetical protein
MAKKSKAKARPDCCVIRIREDLRQLLREKSEEEGVALYVLLENLVEQALGGRVWEKKKYQKVDDLGLGRFQRDPRRGKRRKRRRRKRAA